MFMAGADGKTPELRPPSIKGMMRFWWRAMHGHLSIEELRKKEGELFGSSDEKIGRSKFALSVQRTTETDDDFIIEEYPLPHHTGNNSCKYLDKKPSCKKNDRCSKHFPSKAIASDKTFECIIRVKSGDIARVQTIFEVSIILGGLGKRSRRGFGSIKILNINGVEYKFDYSPDKISGLLNSVINGGNEGFESKNGKIEKKNPAKAAYPYIEEIEIGKTYATSWKDLVKKIGKASHDFDCYHTGFINPYRFASPIYVSIIKDNGDQYLPIITTLNCAFKESVDLPNAEKKKDKTDEFKKAILS